MRGDEYCEDLHVLGRVFLRTQGFLENVYEQGEEDEKRLKKSDEDLEELNKDHSQS